MSELIKTRLPTDSSIPALEREVMIIHTLNRMFNDWRSARMVLEQHWAECWAVYFGTPNAQQWLRSRALSETVGDVGTDWRHHITQGKAFDVVETAIPYFKSASFPNEDWFDLIPVVPIPDPDLVLFLRVLKAYIKTKLDDCQFKCVWEMHLRQLAVCGTSCISLPWRAEAKQTKKNVLVRGMQGNELVEMDVERVIYNAPDMRVEDMFDIWLDPDSDNPNKADMIRRFTLRRGEIVRLIRDGVYPKARVADVVEMKAIRSGRDTEDTYRTEVDRFFGMETTAMNSDVIEVFEFWGCLELPDEELYDVVITWSSNVLLRVETNPYRGGRPFVFGRYTPIHKSPYGWGMLSSVLGNIHELDIIANSRLDGLEITLQPTFLVRNDGTVDPADIVAEPGRNIPVADVDGIRQLVTDNNFAAVSMQEESMREQLIERRTGTSSFVGTSPGRSGERVTAAEVDAVQSAGGNRLSGVYENIERESLLEVVQRCYDYAQQFQAYDEIIPVQGDNSRELLYVQVGMEQLAYDMKVKPIGAKHIADKEYSIRQFMDWLAAINSTPQLVEFVKWNEVATELTRKFIENSPERFIMTQEEAMPAMPPMGPQQQMVEGAKQVGGNELAGAVQGELMADGGANMAAGLMNGMPNRPVFMTPEQSQLYGNPQPQQPI